MIRHTYGPALVPKVKLSIRCVLLKLNTKVNGAEYIQLLEEHSGFIKVY